ISTIHSKSRIAYRRIGPAKNERSMLACYLPHLPAGDSVFLLVPKSESLRRLVLISATMASFVFDYVLRVRLTGANLSWFIVEECPLPRLAPGDVRFHRLVSITGRLTFLHRRFAPEWLRLRHLYPSLADREWKHWWAVTEADRLRLRVEVDALVA